MGRCLADYRMLSEGDRVMVCMSGGKDSYGLLRLLERFRRRAPIRFELLAVHLDQGQPGYDGAPLRDWLLAEGYPHRILREDTYSVVIDNVAEGKTYCALCSRLRRGVLYNAAVELGCTKIALGHHRDDAIETLMLNLMYTGSLRAMPPKLISDDGRNTLIRPLLYVAESKLARYAELLRFPILPCDLCGSQEGLKRQEVKRWLSELEARAPGVRHSMLAALGNVRPSQLMDRALWKQLGLDVAKADEAEHNAPAVVGRRLQLVAGGRGRPGRCDACRGKQEFKKHAKPPGKRLSTAGNLSQARWFNLGNPLSMRRGGESPHPRKP
jgi:tRNA 2-thiocytidine biosynthesis protein TtcA